MKPKVDLLEPLLASLLTLDWEITPESIQKFEKELKLLRKKLSDDSHSKELIELALPVCNYLRIRKGSASPATIQFLHEATRTLHRFHRERKLKVSQRKEVLHGLPAKFQSLIKDVQKVNSAAARATRARPKKTALPRTAKVAPKTEAKTPKRKPAVRRVKKLSPSAVVLQAIKRHKKGVDITTLKNLTGFSDSQIRSIVYRAGKEGKIKRTSRGIYVSA